MKRKLSRNNIKEGDGVFYSHGVFNLTPRLCYEMCIKNELMILDCRESYMTRFKMFGVDSVVYIPFSILQERFKELPDNIMLVVADSAGLKSREAVLFLIGKGFKNVVNMAGGFIEWERDGLPVTTNTRFRLSGSCMCQIKAREKNKS